MPRYNSLKRKFPLFRIMEHLAVMQRNIELMSEVSLS